MKTTYPLKFESFYPNDMAREAALKLWEIQLQEIPEKIIMQALDEMPKKFTWVPEISEFYQLCKSIMPSNKYSWFDNKNIGNYRTIPNISYEKEINLGSKIIKKLLKIFPELHQEMENEKEKKFIFKSYKSAMMLSSLKKHGKRFFPDLSKEKMLEEILKFDESDYLDILKNGGI